MDSCKILSRSYEKQGWWMKTFPLSCPPSLEFLRLPYTCSTLRPWREQFYALNVFSSLFLCSWLSNKGSWRRQLLSSQHRTYTTKKNSRIGIFAMDWSVFALLPIWRHAPVDLCITDLTLSLLLNHPCLLSIYFSSLISMLT